MAPASNRLISSRSSTSCWNRSTSADSRSSAVWARSGISPRLFSSTSTDAASVISGERSSWLTSEANRASRSTRSSRAWAMWLNGTASTSRSGSSPTTSRVSRRPPAMASAAAPTSSRGARARRRRPPARGSRRPPWTAATPPTRIEGQRVERVADLAERHGLVVAGVQRRDGHARPRSRSGRCGRSASGPAWPACTVWRSDSGRASWPKSAVFSYHMPL